MIAFAQHQLGMGNVQLVVQSSASGVLHAVVGPQDLCAIANIDGLKVLLPMRGCKRLMTARDGYSATRKQAMADFKAREVV